MRHQACLRLPWLNCPVCRRADRIRSGSPWSYVAYRHLCKRSSAFAPWRRSATRQCQPSLLIPFPCNCLQSCLVETPCVEFGRARKFCQHKRLLSLAGRVKTRACRTHAEAGGRSASSTRAQINPTKAPMALAMASLHRACRVGARTCRSSERPAATMHDAPTTSR